MINFRVMPSGNYVIGKMLQEKSREDMNMMNFIMKITFIMMNMILIISNQKNIRTEVGVMGEKQEVRSRRVHSRWEYLHYYLRHHFLP